MLTAKGRIVFRQECYFAPGGVVENALGGGVNYATFVTVPRRAFSPSVMVPIEGEEFCGATGSTS